MRTKQRYAGSFRAEPYARGDLERLHAYMTEQGWNTRPLRDTDRAMYGLFDVWTRKRRMSAAQSSAWFSVKRIMKAAGVPELRALTIRVTEHIGDGTEVDPDDVTRMPEMVPLAEVLKAIDARTPDGNPDDGDPGLQGSIARQFDFLRADLTALGVQDGRRSMSDVAEPAS